MIQTYVEVKLVYIYTTGVDYDLPRVYDAYKR